MAAIAELLRAAGETALEATSEGRRVHAGTAYAADVVPAVTGTLICVECAERHVVPREATIAVDHHRPGDPGYGEPPAHYWSASSIGQVWQRLYGAQPPPETLRLIAAADHCLAAAYRGQCPGVDPDVLMRWRVQSRAGHQGRPADAILADIAAARRAIQSAPALDLGRGQTARDLRGQYIPELPEAAARDGICVVATVPSPDGGTKVVCQAGTPEQIAAFLAWAPRQGLVRLYGDPARGFAGGYPSTEAWPHRI